MSRLLIIGQENTAQAGLYTSLAESGFACLLVSSDNQMVDQVSNQPLDLVLVEINGHSQDSTIWELIQNIKMEKQLPAIALISKEALDGVNGHLDVVDDFLTSPYDNRELVLRIKRLLNHKTDSVDGNELIKCDNLVIDPAKCEVTVDGRIVELTFKEYELLKLFASNKGRVFTREALLDKIWGYDYFGGDRTVDVHIRRLRSKIETAGQEYIETVRNIGYRFKKDK